MEMKLEAVVLPVTDVDRAKKFYAGLGWRLDDDIVFSKDVRGVQLTPPGSHCSILFGKGFSTAVPGSAQGLYLVVRDLEDARADLARRGVEVSEPYHRASSGEPVPGLDPDGHSYVNFASFKDPDGNEWQLQEIKKRLPGRVRGETEFDSPNELAGALRRAETAHGRHEARLGHRDEEWPGWYADFMAKEQSGEKAPV
jgi:catechol 2,3-dioxygenase-like lactoylglutathione lyase family enzyme